MAKKRQWPSYVRSIIDMTYEGPRDKQLIEDFQRAQIEVGGAFHDKITGKGQFIMASWCVEQFSIKLITDPEKKFMEKDLVWYDKELGYYRNDGCELIKSITTVFDPFLLNPIKIETVKKVIHMGHIPEPRVNWNADMIIPFANKIVDINEIDEGNIITKELGKENLITLIIPHKYDPNVSTDLVEMFVRQLIPADEVEMLQMWLGYHLWPDYNYHHYALFIGEGANGKTTLTSIMKEIIGKENVVSFTAYQLSSDKDKFVAHNLFGKLANIRGDDSTKKIYNTQAFQEKCGGDLISCDVKNKGHMHFVNHAKLTFAVKRPPIMVDDDSVGAVRRPLLFHFENEFLGDDADKDMIKKMTSPKMMSAWINWLLEGLIKLRQQGKFEDKDIDTKREEYKLAAADPFQLLEDELYIDTNDSDCWIFKTDIYQRMDEICVKLARSPKTDVHIGRWMKKHYPNLRESKKDKKRIWIGLRLRTEEERNFDDGMLEVEEEEEVDDDFDDLD